MLVRKFTIAVAAAAALNLTAAAFAQSAPASAPTATATQGIDGGTPTWIKPETAEERKTRLGTHEDPGPNPDPETRFWRNGQMFHIAKWTKRESVFDPNDPTLVRHAYVNFKYEIYQMNEKYVWVWVAEVPTEEEKTNEIATATSVSSGRWGPDHIAFFKKIRPQFTKLEPATSSKTISFEESSEGLPQAGSWRNSLAVADMNGDGFADLVTPPERKGDGSPRIFLGDGKGKWKLWQEARFSHTLDYGGVSAADLNKDGRMDLVFAVHLNGIYVFLNDGKGNFTESDEGLPRDYPTRRAVTTDIDGDGYPDIVVSNEGPTTLPENPSYGRVRAFLNRNKGKKWEGVNISGPDVRIGGDWLSWGHFNGDRVPDFVASSVYFGSWDVFHLSEGANNWKPAASDGDTVPSLAYYLGSATGKFVKGAKTDDAIVAYTRFWPTDLDERILAKPEVVELTDVDRFVFTKDGVKRIPIMRWSGHVGVRGVGSGDFDGDGNLDVIVTNEESAQRGAIVLLGDGKGGFSRAPVDGLTLDENNLYDIKVADVNGDKRPDVVLMYETMQIRRDDFLRIAVSDRPGSIKVFLNRGAKKNAPAAASKAAK
jgi:FG-GAP-like repeat